MSGIEAARCWRAFIVWFANQEKQDDAERILDEEYKELIKACREMAGDDEALKMSYVELCDKVHLLQPHFERFLVQCCKHSKLFGFWNLYIQTVMLLLRFIGAEREGSWQLHLNAVAEMVPYFFALDRINYARYSLISALRNKFTYSQNYTQ